MVPHVKIAEMMMQEHAAMTQMQTKAKAETRVKVQIGEIAELLFWRSQADSFIVRTGGRHDEII